MLKAVSIPAKSGPRPHAGALRQSSEVTEDLVLHLVHRVKRIITCLTFTPD